MSDPGIAGLLKRLQSPDPLSAWQEFLHEYSPVCYQAARAFASTSDVAADCYLYVCEELARNNFRRLLKFKPDGPASFKTWLLVVARNLCFDWHRKRVGRPRPFKSLQSLSEFEFEVYVCRFERRLSPEQTLEHLRSADPNVGLAHVESAEQKIDRCLNSRQRWILSMRQAESSTSTVLLSEEGEELISQIPDIRADQEMLIADQEQHAQLMKSLSGLPAQERLLVQLRFEQDLSLDEIARIVGLGDAQRVHRQIGAVLQKLRRAIESRGKC